MNRVDAYLIGDNLARTRHVAEVDWGWRIVSRSTSLWRTPTGQFVRQVTQVEHLRGILNSGVYVVDKVPQDGAEWFDMMVQIGRITVLHAPAMSVAE